MNSGPRYNYNTISASKPDPLESVNKPTVHLKGKKLDRYQQHPTTMKEFYSIEAPQK